MKIDKKDRAIITALVKDSKQTTSKLSKNLLIPITTIHNRIKKLEKQGIINNYTVNLNYQKLGKNIQAYISVTVDYSLANNQAEVAKKIKTIPGIQEVTIMTGGTDIQVKAITKDIFELNEIVTEKMRTIPGVDKTQTAIVLKEL